jgi:hypothetical protein
MSWLKNPSNNTKTFLTHQQNEAKSVEPPHVARQTMCLLIAPALIYVIHELSFPDQQISHVRVLWEVLLAPYATGACSSHLVATMAQVSSLFIAEWELYVTSALLISNWAFFICASYMILSVNSDYFLKQH